MGWISSSSVRGYARYVDDFVLIADSPAALLAWQGEIAAWLDMHWGLRLRPGARPRPAGNGVDWLGFILRPGYRLVRRRIVRRVWSALAAFEQRWQPAASAWRLPPAALAKLQAGLASWLGHFRHAAAGRLWQRLCSRFAWLRALFIDVDVALHGGLRPRWRLPRPSAARSLRRQVDAFFSRTRLRRWLVQVGRRYWLMAPGSGRPLALLTPARARGWAAAARAAGTPFGVLVQCGGQRDGRRERQLAAVFQPVTAPNASDPFALSTPSAGVN
jgi:hypothetical protein